MTGRRVAITGLGAISAAGMGAGALWTALADGAGCVGPIEAFDPTGFECHIGGEVAGFSARKFVPKTYRKAVKVMARDIELAVATADLAFRDAGLVTKGIDADNVDIDGARFACSIGAGLICADLDELGAAVQFAVDEQGRFDMRRWGREGMANLTPLWLLKYLPNMLACHVTIIHDLRGPSNTATTAGASSHHSVAEAVSQIARGDADAAIAGGAESKINPPGLLRQSLLRRLATGGNDNPAAACRPFDAGHAGTVIGEGGGLLIFEELDAARRRSARIYGEVVGLGAATDPVAMAPDGEHCGNVGLAAAKAMDAAGITADQLGLVIAHGTGIPHEDRLEAEALRKTLAGADVPIVSLMGAVGNAFAGAGGLSLVAAATALADQTVPASVNFESAAAGCEGLSIPTRAMRRPIEYVLCQSFSCMGQSGAAVLKRREETR